MPQLQSIDYSGNMLTGTIPSPTFNQDALQPSTPQLWLCSLPTCMPQPDLDLVHAALSCFAETNAADRRSWDAFGFRMRIKGQEVACWGMPTSKPAAPHSS